jgi:hypothetical protein
LRKLLGTFWLVRRGGDATAKDVIPRIIEKVNKLVFICKSDLFNTS